MSLPGVEKRKYKLLTKMDESQGNDLITSVAVLGI